MNLEPCPFCGGCAEVEQEGTRKQSCVVACEDCGCRVESNEIGAGQAWNRRAPHPDAKRIDWLADPNQAIGNVTLPTAIVERNVDSLRAASESWP